jgi:hypothetical protein
MAVKKVKDVSKEYGISNKEIMDELKKLGEFVTSVSYPILPPVFKRLQPFLERNSTVFQQKKQEEQEAINTDEKTADSTPVSSDVPESTTVESAPETAGQSTEHIAKSGTEQTAETKGGSEKKQGEQNNDISQKENSESKLAKKEAKVETAKKADETHFKKHEHKNSEKQKHFNQKDGGKHKDGDKPFKKHQDNRKDNQKYTNKPTEPNAGKKESEKTSDEQPIPIPSPSSIKIPVPSKFRLSNNRGNNPYMTHVPHFKSKKFQP